MFQVNWSLSNGNSNRKNCGSSSSNISGIDSGNDDVDSSFLLSL